MQLLAFDDSADRRRSHTAIATMHARAIRNASAEMSEAPVRRFPPESPGRIGRSLLLGGCAVLAAALLLFGCGGKSADELLAEGKVLHEKGERNSAVIHLKNSIQQNPDHAESRLYLGLLYSETGDFRSAEKELRRALD